MCTETFWSPCKRARESGELSRVQRTAEYCSQSTPSVRCYNFSLPLCFRDCLNSSSWNQQGYRLCAPWCNTPTSPSAQMGIRSPTTQPTIWQRYDNSNKAWGKKTNKMQQYRWFIVNYGCWLLTMSQHVSGIFMSIFRSKDHVLLHMKCICW